MRLIVVAISLFCLHPANGQESPGDVTDRVHWAYASYFGTGSYRFDDNQSVFVINTAPLISQKEWHWPGLQDEPSVLNLRLPITAGVASLDLEEIGDVLDLDNLALAGVGIAADIDIPLTERWSLRSNAQIGQGRVLEGGQYAWNYRADIRGQYRFPAGPASGALMAGTGIVGYAPNHGSGDEFVFTELGIEFDYPLEGLGEGFENREFHFQALYTQLPLSVDVQRASGETDQTSNIIDFGIALGKQRGSFSWWIFEVDRLGLTASFSPSSDFRGVKLYLESLYEP